jgi:hypothetical protein
VCQHGYWNRSPMDTNCDHTVQVSVPDITGDGRVWICNTCGELMHPTRMDLTFADSPQHRR